MLIILIGQYSCHLDFGLLPINQSEHEQHDKQFPAKLSLVASHVSQNKIWTHSYSP